MKGECNDNGGTHKGQTHTSQRLLFAPKAGVTQSRSSPDTPAYGRVNSLVLTGSCWHEVSGPQKCEGTYFDGWEWRTPQSFVTLQEMNASVHLSWMTPLTVGKVTTTWRYIFLSYLPCLVADYQDEEKLSYYRRKLHLIKWSLRKTQGERGYQYCVSFTHRINIL